jgi:DNA polymerase I-like protein with 3'-5' exonuclease and polymerase domains
MIELNKERLEALVDADPKRKWVLDTETDGLDVIGSDAPHGAHWIGLMPQGTGHCFVLSRREFDEWARPIVERMHLIGHNLLFDMHALNLTVSSYTDTMLGSYFINTSSRIGMDSIAKRLGYPKITTPDALKKGQIEHMDRAELTDYLVDDVRFTDIMYQKINWQPNMALDMRVGKAIYAMESRGVKLLGDRLSKAHVELLGIVDRTLKDLRDVGMEGDPNSPKQVAAFLMSKGRKLPITDKGNVSTSKLVLQRMADNGDDLAGKVLAYRKAIKLDSSFLKPLPKIARHGVLYPQTNISGTVTGRFSCSKPNLQQIPKRGALGKSLRRCMTSVSGTGVTACDYSQVELRVAAAMADEPTLLEAFANGGDPHTEVAAKMLGKRAEDITPDERYKAKAVNFGILNGMGARRLAIELKSDYDEANKFLSNYKRNLPHLSAWMEGVWRQAETFGIVRTLSGRTRVFAGDDSTRPSISVVVQGTAAELIRHAIVGAHEAGLPLMLSVHDEILVEGDHRNQLKEIMEDCANKAFPEVLGKVSFTAEATYGETWGDT